MIQIHDKRDCCGCTACVERCPKQCITMTADEEGFLYPHVNLSLCINCRLCERVCPVINQQNGKMPLGVYAVMNPNTDVRLKSSSGGLFTMLAEKILAEDGIVFGVAFDTDWSVKHIGITKCDELERLRGSKYLQSRVETTFKEVEGYLKSGRKVLYSGTSCQIAGLKHYLRKDYSNLLSVDCLCHGVPSPEVWTHYLKRICGNKEITNIKFRDKRTGWKQYSFTIDYTDGTIYTEKASGNVFMRGFLSDLYLRPSRERCPAKSGKCRSDITLADYWGVDRFYPQIDDDKGIGLVLVHSHKGEEYIASVSPIRQIVDFDQAKLFNGGFKEKVIPSRKRSVFFQKMAEGEDIIKLIEKCLRPSFYIRTKILIKRVINKLR